MGADRRESSTYLMLVVTMALWGSASAGSKVALVHVPHGVAAMLRFGLGALLMVGWLALVGGLRLSTRELGRLAIAGALGVFGYNALFLGGMPGSVAGGVWTDERGDEGAKRGGKAAPRVDAGPLGAVCPNR